MNGGLSMVEMKSGYKMTEVGVIPEDWEVKNVSESCLIKARIGWQGLKKSEYMSSGDYLLITGTDFDNGQVNWKSCAYVSKARYEQDSNIKIRPQDILISKDGTIGKVAYLGMIPKAGTLNSGIFVIRANDRKIDQVFLSKIFMSFYFEEFLNRLVAGSTINHLYQKDFVKFCFPLPNSEEQVAIAAALSDVDSLISALTKKIEKKKAIKQGLMQQLLTGKKRLLGFGDVWDVVQLKRIISEFIVPMRDKPTALTGPIPWCRIEDFDGKYLKKSLSNQGVDLNTVSKMNLKIFPVNTLLVSCSANLGRCAIVKQKLVTNQTFIGLVPSDRIDVEFLYYKMSREDKNLNNMATGTTISYLSREQFENYEILIPSSKAEQTAIANILSDCDSEIAALEEKRDKYKEIKQGMMQQLLTGKIRLIK